MLSAYLLISFLVFLGCLTERVLDMFKERLQASTEDKIILALSGFIAAFLCGVLWPVFVYVVAVVQCADWHRRRKQSCKA